MSYWCHECIRGFNPPSQQQPPSQCPHCGSDFIEFTNNSNHNDPLNFMSSEDEDNYNSGEDFEESATLWIPPRRVMMRENGANPHGNQIMDYTDLARWFLSMGISRGQMANLGDYGIGQSLDDILNMSFEQDQSSGPPPASKKELSRLKRFKITKEHVAGNLECTVCTEKYRINEFCHLLPCKHFFHQDCIKPWLQLHNTCPVCRYELKTDDIEYEAKKKKVSNTPSSTPSSTTTTSPTPDDQSPPLQPLPPQQNSTINSPTPMNPLFIIPNTTTTTVPHYVPAVRNVKVPVTRKPPPSHHINNSNPNRMGQRKKKRVPSKKNNNSKK